MDFLGSVDRDAELIGWVEDVVGRRIDEAGYATAKFLMVDKAWMAGGAIIVATIIAVTLIGFPGLVLLGALYLVKRLTNPQVVVAVSRAHIFLISLGVVNQKPDEIISKFPISAVGIAKGDPMLISIHGRTYEVDEANWRRLLKGLAIAEKCAAA